MNHATLRKIAAATAVICESQGGKVGFFFLMKALYLSDRQMLIDYGVPITGDTYSSMKSGPILCATLDLLYGKFADKNVQAEWNAAIVKKDNVIYPVAKIDTDCLSLAEEEILREKIAMVVQMAKDGVNVADWMHKNCPEWEQVASGSSKQIKMATVLEKAKGISAEQAKSIKESIDDALLNRAEGALAGKSLLASA